MVILIILGISLISCTIYYFYYVFSFGVYSKFILESPPTFKWPTTIICDRQVRTVHLFLVISWRGIVSLSVSSTVSTTLTSKFLKYKWKKCFLRTFFSKKFNLGLYELNNKYMHQKIHQVGSYLGPSEKNRCCINYEHKIFVQFFSRQKMNTIPPVTPSHAALLSWSISPGDKLYQQIQTIKDLVKSCFVFLT